MKEKESILKQVEEIGSESISLKKKFDEIKQADKKSNEKSSNKLYE